MFTVLRVLYQSTSGFCRNCVENAPKLHYEKTEMYNTHYYMHLGFIIVFLTSEDTPRDKPMPQCLYVCLYEDVKK